MEPLAILTSDPLDLLFDNRNKDYGAYPLRKYYDRRLLTGLLLSASAGIIFFSLLSSGPAAPMATDFFLSPDVVLRPVPPAPPVRPASAPASPHIIHAATIAHTTIQIVPPDQVRQPLHTNEELDRARIGVTDLAGPADAKTYPAGPVNAAATGAGEGTKQSEPPVYRSPDVMPRFPGGQEALLRFLNRNLRMPDGAEAGTKVSVLATFVVGADGQVRQAEMTRSGGERFDAEVKRVLAKMPAWIPGRMGEKAVPVYFSLPVQFVVPEE